MKLIELAERLRAERLAKAARSTDVDRLAGLAHFALATHGKTPQRAENFSQISRNSLSQAEISSAGSADGAFGDSACEIEAHRIKAWLLGLDGLPEPRSDLKRRLRVLTEEFWLGPWAHPTLVAGWVDDWPRTD